VGAKSDRTALFRVIAGGLGVGRTALLESENGSSSSRRPSTSRLKTTSGERRTNGEGASVAVLRAQALARGAVEAAAEATTLVPVASQFASATGSAWRPPAGSVGASEGSGQPVAVNADALRGALAPLVRELLRESIAPVHALLAQPARSAAAGDGDGRQLQRTTAALEDAHARIRQLEKEMGELRRELGAAQAARDLAGEYVNAMLAETITASGRDAVSLARAADHLAGTRKISQGAERCGAAAGVGRSRRAAHTEPSVAGAH